MSNCINSLSFGCVKAPGLNDRKSPNINQYGVTYDRLTAGAFTQPNDNEFMQLDTSHGGQDAPFPFEGCPAMHRQDIIQYQQIPFLPGESDGIRIQHIHHMIEIIPWDRGAVCKEPGAASYALLQ